MRRFRMENEAQGARPAGPARFRPGCAVASQPRRQCSPPLARANTPVSLQRSTMPLRVMRLALPSRRSFSRRPLRCRRLSGFVGTATSGALCSPWRRCDWFGGNLVSNRLKHFRGIRCSGQSRGHWCWRLWCVSNRRHQHLTVVDQPHDAALKLKPQAEGFK